ncbi:ATP-binding protein [Streptomyces sp. GD-15H]|uniref:ATP-binding protein n=1 Tax=Streptomyces sp. GD-15H TaxID=3129112 RepID=UPI00387317F3
MAAKGRFRPPLRRAEGLHPPLLRHPTRCPARPTPRLPADGYLGWSYGSPAHDSVELVVAELARNAVTHGRVPGRDAELRLTVEPCGRLVRVEVSDARGERRPVRARGERPDMDGGRGLTLVEALAGEWGVTERLGPGQDRVGRHSLHRSTPLRPECRSRLTAELSLVGVEV